MARFLLDTNFCIACLRRKPWALEILRAVPLSSVAVASITAGELVLGAILSDRPAQERTKVETFLRPIQILPFGREAAFQWATLDAELRKQGSRIETEDAVIAATAMALDMTVVTGNGKHFGRVRGLELVDWEQAPPLAE